MSRNFGVRFCDKIERVMTLCEGFEQGGIGSIFKQEKGMALLLPSHLTSDGRADRIHEVLKA